MLKRVACSSCMLAILATLAGPTAAQQLKIAPGVRVRITTLALHPDPLVGIVDALQPGTLRLRTNDTSPPWEIPISQIARLQVSEGRKSHIGAGALAGAVGGLAIGVGIATAFCGGWTSACAVGGFASTGDLALPLGAFGATTGAVLGTLIGLAIKSDRWADVPVEQLGVSLLPSADGALAIVVSRSLR